MPEGGKSGRSGLSKNGKRKYDRAIKAGFSQRQAVRIGNGTLRRR